MAHSDVRINATEQTTRDAEISDDRFSGPPGVSFEEQMDDQPELHDSVTQTISTSEAMIQTKELIYAGVKDNDGRMRDDSGKFLYDLKIMNARRLNCENNYLSVAEAQNKHL